MKKIPFTKFSRCSTRDGRLPATQKRFALNIGPVLYDHSLWIIFLGRH